MKVLYLSHIDWGWIKQRPQFVAEYLIANDVECVIYYQKSLNFRSMVSFNMLGYSAKPLWKVPLKNRSRFLLFANKLVQKLLLKSAIIKHKPDVIWVTHPEFADVLPNQSKIPVIYDCMDDIVAFYERGSWIGKHFAGAELRLVNQASHVFFSSEHLAQTVLARTNLQTNHTLVRNAYNARKAIAPSNLLSLPDGIQTRRPKKLAYFGTIASWLDMKALVHCCEIDPGLEIDLYGPLESKDLFKSLPPGIRYQGILPHEKLRNCAEQYDVLIMPFVVNDLIKSVDPVKLYEYIDFDKPIISVFYNEIRRFESFVNFYRTPDDFAALLRTGCHELKKYDDDQRQGFLKENTWNERAKTMKSVMMSI